MQRANTREKILLSNSDFGEECFLSLKYCSVLFISMESNR